MHLLPLLSYIYNMYVKPFYVRPRTYFVFCCVVPSITRTFIYTSMYHSHSIPGTCDDRKCGICWTNLVCAWKINGKHISGFATVVSRCRRRRRSCRHNSPPIYRYILVYIATTTLHLADHFKQNDSCVWISFLPSNKSDIRVYILFIIFVFIQTQIYFH